MIKVAKFCVALFAAAGVSLAYADTIVPMNFTGKNIGKAVGTVKITETSYGLLFTPDLKGLMPGIHGFHIHQKPNCLDNGMAAGGHWDPQGTNAHLGPFNDNGHQGDLPILYVDIYGNATLPVMAPKIAHVGSIVNLALMIHSGGDNYSDTPQPLGGGDGRMACGVIKS